MNVNLSKPKIIIKKQDGELIVSILNHEGKELGGGLISLRSFNFVSDGIFHLQTNLYQLLGDHILEIPLHHLRLDNIDSEEEEIKYQQTVATEKEELSRRKQLVRELAERK